MDTTERPIIKMKDKSITRWTGARTASVTISNETQIIEDFDNVLSSLGFWMQEWKQLHDQTEDIMNESNARGWSWIEHLEHMLAMCDDIGKFLEAHLEGGLPKCFGPGGRS